MLVEQRIGQDQAMWTWPKLDVRCWKSMMRHWWMPKDIINLIKNNDDTFKTNLVVQAGGNGGVYPWQYAEIFDSVITFEPDHLNFYCMSQNLSNCDNVIKMQSFLGDKGRRPAGIVNHAITKSTNHTTDHPTGRPTEYNTGAFEIDGHGHTPVVAIDSLNLQSCDLIHLDIEGSELDALIGAENTIRNFKPILCIEWFYNTGKIIELISKWGYKELVNNNISDKIFESI